MDIDGWLGHGCLLTGLVNQAVLIRLKFRLMSKAFAHLVVLSDPAGGGLPIVKLGGRRENRLLAMYKHATN